MEQLEPRRLLALSIQLNAASLVEGQSMGGLIVRSGGSVSTPLTVALASSAPEAVGFASPSVVIPANSSSAAFSLAAVADGVVDLNQRVTITASAIGQPQATEVLTIVNAEALPLRIGPVDDQVAATPTEVADRFEVTGASLGFIAPSVVDLTHDTPADQRTALPLSPAVVADDQRYLWSSSLVKIDPAALYEFSADAKETALVTDDRPLAFQSYDADKRLIEAIHVARYQLAVDTTLARTLRPGDKVIYVANASGWSNDPWETGDTRALAWYSYHDSTGHVYADYTYTRHVAAGSGDGLWAAGNIRFDDAVGAYAIKLRAPWSGPNLAAGTAVRNAQGGPATNVPATVQTTQDPETHAATFAATIGGGFWQAGLQDGSRFRPGTAYVKPAVHGAAVWNGLAIAPLGDAALGPLDFTLPVAQLDSASRVPLVLDVLAKQVFGPAANVVIESVAPPQHGTAEIAAGPAGRNVLQYLSPEGFVGTEEIVYTLRNTADNTTFTGRIEVTIASDEALRKAKLRDVALGMLNYEAVRSRFPIVPTASHFDAAGNPLLSWRVHILPYLGHDELYNQFHLDEPWNSAHNLPLAQQMPTVFRDPDAVADATTTRLRIISGEGSEYYWQRSGGLLVGPRYTNFDDGLSNTLLVVETGSDAAITWTQPDLPNFDPAQPLAALGTIAGDAIRAVTADAIVFSLPATIDPRTFAGLVTIAGGEVLDAGTLQRQFAEAQGPDAVADFEARQYSALRRVALAMFNHLDVHGRFPLPNVASYFDAQGNPLLSWRVHLLPFLEHENLYAQFHLNEPWDSPHNLPLAALMPDVYRSAGDSATSIVTRLKTFTGPDAPFEYLAAGQLQAGPRASAIADEHAMTIMVAEAGPDRAVMWTKPEDTPLDVANPLAGLGTLPGDKLQVVMFDGSTYAFSTHQPEVIAALATRRGREIVDPAREDVSGFEAFATEKRTQLNRLRELALGAVHYSDARKYYPPDRFAADGTPLLSWRVEVLPYIGFGDLYSRFRRNEPWDSPHNLSLLPLMPSVFRSEGDPVDTMLTRVMQFTGPGAPFPAAGDSSLRGPRESEITDSRSGTILFVEAGEEVSVPWTKPGGLEYHEENPYSQLGQIGSEFLPAFFDGSVREQPSSLPISALTELITHAGGASGDTPPAAPYVRQSHGDARLAEAGADWFDVVFDAPPTTPQTLLLSVDNPAVALLDKQQLTFDATNWNVPQRVVIRGVDNFAVNADRTVEITVGSQSLQATIVDDDRPPPSADFDADELVAGGDFLLWQRNYGTSSAVGDANHDATVDGDDLAEWDRQFGDDERPTPEADFDFGGSTDGRDFLLWQRNHATTSTTGDADGNGVVDGRDLAAWQLRFGAIGSASSDVAATAVRAESSAVRTTDVVFEQFELGSLAQLSDPSRAESEHASQTMQRQKGVDRAPQSTNLRGRVDLPRQGDASRDASSGRLRHRQRDTTPDAESERRVALRGDGSVADETLAAGMNS